MTFTTIAAAIVAGGWVAGAALVAVAALAGKAPQNWALRELGEGRARRFSLAAGIALVVIATILFVIVDRLVFAGIYS